MFDRRVVKLIIGCFAGYVAGLYAAAHLPFPWAYLQYAPYAGGIAGVIIVQLPGIVWWLLRRIAGVGRSLTHGFRLSRLHLSEVFWACCAIEMAAAMMLCVFLGSLFFATGANKESVAGLLPFVVRYGPAGFAGLALLSIILIIADFASAEREHSGSAFRGSRRFVLLWNPLMIVAYQIPRVLILGFLPMLRFIRDFVRDSFRFGLKCCATPFVILFRVFVAIHRHPSMLVVIGTALVALLVAISGQLWLAIVGIALVAADFIIVTRWITKKQEWLDNFFHGFFG